MKVIKCNTPKGQYQIPLKKVSENRADYYIIEKDGLDKKSIEYQNEVKWVMNDDFEGIDWLLNNTDWEDWKDIAIKINDIVKVNEDDFWCDSDDFEIIENK